MIKDPNSGTVYSFFGILLGEIEEDKGYSYALFLLSTNQHCPKINWQNSIKSSLPHMRMSAAGCGTPEGKQRS